MVQVQAPRPPAPDRPAADLARQPSTWSKGRWRRLTAGFIVTSVVQAGLLLEPTQAAHATPLLSTTTVGGYTAVVLPAVDASSVRSGDPAAQQRVTTAALEAVEATVNAPRAAAAANEAGGPVDSVVLFVDEGGSVIRPDADRARQAGTVAAGDLTFTFDSPAQPFTPEQISLMQTWIRDFYPVVRDLYGPPAFAITVNVRLDPSVKGGLYFTGSNEIIVSDLSEIDVFVHEMTHAFHDDDIILSQWEETMTRAVEVTSFDRVGTYQHWNPHHSYEHDEVADSVDAQPALGSTWMNMSDGFPPVLLRYNVGGYEWWKVFFSRPTFFSDFNRMLYADPSRAFQEARLVEIAATAAPTVEGLPFSSWYIARGIFNSAPPVGYQIATLKNTGWLFLRDEGGGVYPIAGVPVSWQSQAIDGRVLASGTTTTWGSGYIGPTTDPVPGTYAGRVLFTFRTTVEGQEVSAVTWLTTGPREGLYGVAPGVNTGSVTVARLDDPSFVPLTAPVTKGAFDFPSLASIPGRFRATLNRPDGTVAAQRVFTKDSSPYFLILERRPAPVVNLTSGAVTAPASVTRGTGMYVTVAVRNAGPSTAAPSRSQLFLSADAVRDGSDIRLSTPSPSRAIPGGVTLTNTQWQPIPATTSRGTYRLLSCADDNQLVPETNEADNCNSSTVINVVAPQPNLVVSSVRTPPTQVRRGATFTGANTTRNVGTLAAPASRDRYLLSRDKARDGADVALAPRRAVGPLAPNEQSFGSVAVKVPSTTATGLYWLLVCADDTGLVAEANEADNCRTATTQLRITN
jgi:hypothetical protein